MEDPWERPKQVLKTRFGPIVQIILRPLDMDGVELGFMFLEWIHSLSLNLIFPWEVGTWSESVPNRTPYCKAQESGLSVQV